MWAWQDEPLTSYIVRRFRFAFDEINSIGALEAPIHYVHRHRRRHDYCVGAYVADTLIDRPQPRALRRCRGIYPTEACAHVCTHVHALVYAHA